MRLDELKTPCAIVDLDVVERNTARMAERMTKLGVRLRPHVKTHKCVEAARLQVRGHFGGITVSTLAEARHFKKAGFDDITYAFPLAVSRIEEAAELGVRVVIDQEETLAEIEKRELRLPAYLKVDCGYHRAGVDPDRPESVALARRLARSLDFRGILTHAGHSYASRTAEEIRAVARAERDVMVAFAKKLREAGCDPKEISVGSTPTMSVVEDLSGVTEARPGNYVFYDAFQASIGSCRIEDAALSVLASVVGRYPAQKKILVDAGALALSKDAGPTHVDAECGYGAIFGLDGRRFDGTIFALSQEHGQVRGDAPVGAKLRIAANHSCLTAAMYDRYAVVRGGEVVDEWKPVRGW